MKWLALAVLLTSCSAAVSPERWVDGIGIADSAAPEWARDDAAFLAEVDAVSGGRAALRGGVTVWIHPGAIDCGGVPAVGCCWWDALELSSGADEYGYHPTQWSETALRHELAHLTGALAPELE